LGEVDLFVIVRCYNSRLLTRDEVLEECIPVAIASGDALEKAILWVVGKPWIDEEGARDVAGVARVAGEARVRAARSVFVVRRLDVFGDALKRLFARVVSGGVCDA